MVETSTARRIALLGHRLASPSATGIGRYYVEISRGLAQVADPATHQYLVASTREPTSPDWLPPHLPHRFLPGHRKVRALAWGLFGWPPVDRALGEPDLVHLLHPWSRVPSRAPLVVTLHDLIPMLHPEWHARVESWSFTRGVAHARDHASLVVTESQYAADEITAAAGIEPARIRVVWGGVGDEFRRRAGADEADAVCARHGVERGRYLIVVGAVSTRKNLSVLLKALARTIPDALGATALLSVGPPGVGSAAIEDEVDRLQLHDRMRFAGYVSNHDLPVLVGSSLALVHPSRDEGFGITPIEAMAAGVPAIVSDAGSIPEVAGAAAVLVDPDDVDGWADAITTIAGDPERRAAVIAAGDRHQERFRWTRAAAETMALHDEVLDR